MKFIEDDNRNAEIKYLNRVISEKEEHIKKLDSELNEKDIIISRTKSYLFDLEYELNNANNKINSLESNLSKKEAEINSKENKINTINSKLNIKDDQINEIESELEKNKRQNNALNSQINSLKNDFNDNIKDNELQKSKFETDEGKYYYQLSKLDSKEYCIRCYKEQIKNNDFEIDYLKKNTLTKKILNPFAYLYLLFKSNTNELSINFKLYKALKNSGCFDIGYYLNNNKDIIGSKWCKYFSPELHYVCNGFNEGREFNKKYFNKNSKKELLEYMLKCI